MGVRLQTGTGMQNNIYYAEKDYTIYIKATGHITAQICFGLRQRVFERLDRTPKIEAIALIIFTP